MPITTPKKLQLARSPMDVRAKVSLETIDKKFRYNSACQASPARANLPEKEYFSTSKRKTVLEKQSPSLAHFKSVRTPQADQSSVTRSTLLSHKSFKPPRIKKKNLTSMRPKKGSANTPMNEAHAEDQDVSMPVQMST